MNEMGGGSLLDAREPAPLPAPQDAPRYELRPREHRQSGGNASSWGWSGASTQTTSSTWSGWLNNSGMQRDPVPKLCIPLPNGDTKLLIEYGDITLWRGDAIVNAANASCLGGAGVDGAIHRAAGPQLYRACRELPVVARSTWGEEERCRVGEAVITDSGFLKNDRGIKKVIHTVGPIFWRHTPAEAAALLTSCYRDCLRLAREHGLRRIACPAISCGAYGFPLALAATEAVAAIAGACQGLTSVSIVLFERDAVAVWDSAASALLKPDGPAIAPVPPPSDFGPPPPVPPAVPPQQPSPPSSPPLPGVPIDGEGGGLEDLMSFEEGGGWDEVASPPPSSPFRPPFF